MGTGAEGKAIQAGGTGLYDATMVHSTSGVPFHLLYFLSAGSLQTPSYKCGPGLRKSVPSQEHGHP